MSQYLAISVQKELNAKGGAAEIDVDGINGRETINAIKKFQKEYDLPVSGKVDEVTAKRLFNQ